MQRSTVLHKTSLPLVLFLSVIGFGLALYELLSPASGTAGTAGAILVTVSTALMAAALLLLVLAPPQGRAFGFLLALVLLAAAGTGAAAYFLMAHLLLAAMIAALFVGLAAAFSGRRTERVSQ